MHIFIYIHKYIDFPLITCHLRPSHVPATLQYYKIEEAAELLIVLIFFVNFISDTDQTIYKNK